MAPRKPPRRTRWSANKVAIREDTREVDGAVKSSEHQPSEQPEGVPQEEQEVWDSIREEQYEVIEQLPLTLHRMLALLRELDERYASQTAELQQTIRRYISLRQTIDRLSASQSTSEPPQGKLSTTVNNQKLNLDLSADGAKVEPHISDMDAIFDLPAHGESQKLLSRISWLNSESVRTSDEKLALATTAYDLVDRHVRSLDLAIKAEEASFALGLRPGTQPIVSVMQHGGPSSLAKKAGVDETMQSTTSSGRPRSRNKPRRPRPAVAEHEPLQPPPQSPSVDANGVPPAQQLPNMAIDPNEPRYCYCDQVSFGEMIACDNDDCEREWFHYGCVGITETPKRRWFCRDCEITLGIQPRKRKHS